MKHYGHWIVVGDGDDESVDDDKNDTTADTLNIIEVRLDIPSTPTKLEFQRNQRTLYWIAGLLLLLIGSGIVVVSVLVSNHQSNMKNPPDTSNAQSKSTSDNADGSNVDTSTPSPTIPTSSTPSSVPPLRSPPLPGKKGAAFTLRATGEQGDWNTNLPKVMALNPYWNYSWGPKQIEAQPTNIEFVPMLWGGQHPPKEKFTNVGCTRCAA